MHNFQLPYIGHKVQHVSRKRATAFDSLGSGDDCSAR